MTTSKMLTQEQIDAALRETRAAVERGRKTLERSREIRAKAGVRPEKIERYFDRMSPRARTWINSMVGSGLAEVTARKPAGSKAPRKHRSMI
jgi:hypothetical protein